MFVRNVFTPISRAVRHHLPKDLESVCFI